MKVFHQLDDIRAVAHSSAVAIGNFDGVHLGHAALLKDMFELAKSRKLTPVVLTFFPHPVEVLRPGKVLERLTTTSEKLALLESMGVEMVLVAAFDESVAKLTPVEFFDRYLVDTLKAKSVHVGFNFKFGKDRAGDSRMLEQLCRDKSIEPHALAPFERNGVKVSSTEIRTLIREGEVKEAATYLGRPYQMWGQVMRGDQRGRQLGFPTANLRVSGEKQFPSNGVYVTRVTWQKQTFLSVTNIGLRPTFHDGKSTPTLEVHLLDFSTKIYDEFLNLEFLDRLRDEKKFESIEALIAQIKADVATARKLVG